MSGYKSIIDGKQDAAKEGACIADDRMPHPPGQEDKGCVVFADGPQNREHNMPDGAPAAAATKRPSLAPRP